MKHQDVDLFRFFSGTWTLTRTVYDGEQRCVAQASGIAEFTVTAVAGELCYAEHGQLELTAPVAADALPDLQQRSTSRPIPFTRRFRYVWRDDVVEVFFADGADSGKSYQRYCWSAAQRTLSPIETHACLADSYNSQYHIADASHFNMRTTIRGPHKDQTLHTYFVRSTTPAGAQQ